MLSSQALNAVLLTVDQIETSGRSLSPLAGTELARLYDTSISAATAASIATMDSEIPYQALLDDSTVLDNGAITHDEAMQHSIDAVSKVILANLDIARNYAIPRIKEVNEKYGTYLETTSSESVQPAVIIPNVYHDVWNSNELEGLVSRFATVAVDQYRFPFALPNIDGDQIRAMMKTGIAQLDDMVEDWLNDLPENKLLEAYANVFMRGTPVGKLPGANHVTDQYLDRNDLLIAHLISIGYEEDLPDGVNAPLLNLRESMSIIRRQTGRAIAGTLERRERDIRGKILAFGTNITPWKYSAVDNHVEVLVNNDVYLNYLKEGGTVEAIYGAALKGDRLDYNSLIANNEMYVKYYDRKLALYRQEVGSKAYIAKQEALRFALRDVINSLSEEELTGSKAEMHRQAFETIACFEPRDYNDVIVVMRKVVCTMFYADTNVEMVLDAMDAAEQSDPEITPRECALHATIDLIARWLASQINVAYN